MFRVRVNKIESTRDVDGNLGKRIELVEEREISNYVMRPQTDEAKMIQDVLQAVQQQMPMFQPRQAMAVPKILLFLTEEEYDLIIERLGTEFHALLMVLMQKRLITLADVRAAERRLDLAAEVAKAQEIAAIERDVQTLADELDATPRADEAA